MMNHKNFHPEICKLLDELEGLRSSADLRARDLLRDDIDRTYSQAIVDDLDYCMMRIRDMRLPIHPSKFNIGDLVADEDGNSGIVVIKWDDGDLCSIENDAAHPNPTIV